MRLFFALALLGASTSAVAADWVHVAENDSFTSLTDRTSLRRTGSRVRGWEMKVHASPTAAATDPSKTYQSVKRLMIYNCVERTSAASQIIRYATADGGEVVESATFEEKEMSFQESPPDSIGEAMLDYACKNAPRTKK